MPRSRISFTRLVPIWAGDRVTKTLAFKPEEEAEETEKNPV